MILLSALYFLTSWLDKPQLFDIMIYGFFLSSGVVFLGVIVTNFTFQKSMKVFMGAVLGGVFVRILLIAGTGFIIIKLKGFNFPIFTLITIGFYFIFQFIELYLVNKHLVPTMNKPKESEEI